MNAIGYDAAITAALEHVKEQKVSGYYHIGCSLFVNGHLVVTTTNSKTLHAEMSAILLADILPDDIVDIVTVRLTKDPKKPIGSSKPCRDCLDFMKAYSVRSVQYSLDTGESIMMKPNEISPHFCARQKWLSNKNSS